MYQNLSLLARKILRFFRSGSTESRDYLNYLEYLRQSKNQLREVGLVNLTLDLELAWSRVRRGNDCLIIGESLKRGKRAREATEAILELSDSYEIPITFAVVGHIALDNCAGHAEPPPFKPYWVNRDWFAIDPHSNINLDQDYYGLDLIRRILQSKQSHEIASHGFSHIDLSDDATTPEVAEFEISESAKVLRVWDKDVSSFIFPKNRPAFLELLKSAGFKIYRNSKNQPIAKDSLGLWQFPLGLWLSPLAFEPNDIVRLIRLAFETKQVINFWNHGYEFQNRQQTKSFFKPIFQALNKCRDQGLEVKTMRDIIKNYNE